MKIKLVFYDWRDQKNQSIYATERGIDLSMNDFHSGTTFNGTIDLDEEQADELKRAIGSGSIPVFQIFLPREGSR